MQKYLDTGSTPPHPPPPPHKILFTFVNLIKHVKLIIAVFLLFSGQKRSLHTVTLAENIISNETLTPGWKAVFLLPPLALSFGPVL